MSLRFDDRIATLLAQPLASAAQRAVLWRQLIDVSAQGTSGAVAAEAIDALRSLRSGVPFADRGAAAAGLAGRRLPIELVELFVEDSPALAGPLLGSIRLAEAEWLVLLPALSPTLRGFVRNRRDLSGAVKDALAAFGATDLVIEAPPALALVPDPTDDAEEVETALEAAEPPPPGPVQIRDLVARIEAFRSRGGSHVDDAGDHGLPRAEQFRFEAGSDGVILQIDDAPREALIGIGIARAAASGSGVDGHAAGAFQRRAPFRDARLEVAGDGAAAGAWRISAVPVFEPRSGRFEGYRGWARRPRIDETAAPAHDTVAGLSPDSLRQLVHELRTPLNAILGFADMIAGQVMGPAAVDYRARALDIVGEGRRLLAAVDDLDAAARLAGRRWNEDGGATDLAALVERVAANFRGVARERGGALDVLTATGIEPVLASPQAAERMVSRLLAAVIGLTQPDERLLVRLDAVGHEAVLALARPRMLRDLPEATLLDPGYSPDGDWPEAPLLGLGFALRLVRNLAAAAQGSLAIEADHFLLRLPSRTDSDLSDGSSQG